MGRNVPVAHLSAGGGDGGANGRLGKLEADMGTVKTDIAVMKTDIALLKSDVAVLKADVAVLKTDVAAVKTDVAGLKSDARFFATKGDVAEAKASIVMWIAGSIVVNQLLPPLLVALRSALNLPP